MAVRLREADSIAAVAELQQHIAELEIQVPYENSKVNVSQCSYFPFRLHLDSELCLHPNDCVSVFDTPYKSSFRNCNKNILIVVKFIILMYTQPFIKYILIVVQPISKTLHLVKLKLVPVQQLHIPSSLNSWKPPLYFLSLD